jgi:hypothetical protein
MSNFLDLRCPHCGNTDRIDICAEVWIRVTRDGTDADASREGDHHFTPDSIAQCGCGHFAKLRDFEAAGDAR